MELFALDITVAAAQAGVEQLRSVCGRFISYTTRGRELSISLTNTGFVMARIATSKAIGEIFVPNDRLAAAGFSPMVGEVDTLSGQRMRVFRERTGTRSALEGVECPVPQRLVGVDFDRRQFPSGAASSLTETYLITGDQVVAALDEVCKAIELAEKAVA